MSTDAPTKEQEAPVVPEDPPPGNAGRGKAAKAAAKQTRYRIYLDPGSIGSIQSWANEINANESFDASALPDFSDSDDLVYLTTLPAVDRDGAIEALLDGGCVETDRAKVVRAAHEAHVDIDFQVVPESYVGTVPVHWEITPTRKIGGR